jgi:hypothetical protein
MQVVTLPAVLDLDAVAAAVIPEAGVQRLVQVGHQVAEPAESLPSPDAVEFGLREAGRVLQNRFRGTAPVRTVPLAIVPLAVPWQVDVVLGCAPCPLGLVAYRVRPDAGSPGLGGQPFLGWRAEDFHDAGAHVRLQLAQGRLRDPVVAGSAPAVCLRDVEEPRRDQCLPEKSTKFHADETVSL